jgi:hypothetical protein
MRGERDEAGCCNEKRRKSFASGIWESDSKSGGAEDVIRQHINIMRQMHGCRDKVMQNSMHAITLPCTRRLRVRGCRVLHTVMKPTPRL